MTARTDFRQQVAAIVDALTLPAVQAATLTPLPDSARLLRNGLTIVSFAAIEDFVRQRTAELLAALDGTVVAFPDLPSALQEAATKRLVKTLGSLSDQWDRDGVLLAELQLVGQSLASTGNQPYRLSPFGLTHTGSNVGVDDVREILRILHIDGGWLTVNRVAVRLGLATAALEVSYRAHMYARHNAAHRPGANTPYGDIVGYVRTSTIFAVTFDTLLTRAMVRVRDRVTPPKVNDTDVRLRFVDEGGDGRWREAAEGRRTFRSGSALSAMRAEALARARARQETLVMRARSPLPTVGLAIVDWETTDPI